MAWTRLLPVADVATGTARSVRQGLDDLLVCAVSEDSIHVVENVCSHDDAPLGDQDLDGCQVTCPRHGARFDITTGAVLKSPAPVGITAFPTRIVEGWVEADLEG